MTMFYLLTTKIFKRDCSNTKSKEEIRELRENPQ